MRKKKSNIFGNIKNLLYIEVKNRKIHLTSTKINEIIFCLQDFENYPICDILGKKQKIEILIFMDFGDQFEKKSMKFQRKIIKISSKN